MSFGNTPSIPRLPDEKQLISKESWRPYKKEVLFAVWSKKLTGYINRTIPKPNSYPGPLYPPTQTTTLVFSPTPYPEEWEVCNRQVAGAIVSNITDPVRLCWELPSLFDANSLWFHVTSLTYWTFHTFITLSCYNLSGSSLRVSSTLSITYSH